MTCPNCQCQTAMVICPQCGGNTNLMRLKPLIPPRAGVQFTDMEVKVFRRMYRCPHCDSSDVRFTCTVLLSMPAQYVHTCGGCGKTFNAQSQQGAVHYGDC